MRPILIILAFVLTSSAFGQSLNDKYLHFDSHYFWDTILYKSEQSHYYEVNKGRIIEKDYPVLIQWPVVVGEKPIFIEDRFLRRNYSSAPYLYRRKGNSLYLEYYDQYKRKTRLNKEYSLIDSDTIGPLVDKKSLSSKDGISVRGFSTYLGQMKVELNGVEVHTFRFLEDYPVDAADGTYYTTEVFLEQTRLIPIKFIKTYYSSNTKSRKLFSVVKELASSGNSLPDYSSKKENDLILFENKSTNWTEAQKKEFMERVPSDLKLYAACLLEKLDGKISYFQYEKNRYFRQLIASGECE